MLTLWRRTGRRGAYPDCALILLHEGQVIGELLILQACDDGFGDGARVQVGLNLRADIEVVRADARARRSGPSDEWLAARAADFDTRQPFIRTDGYPTVSAAFRAVGPYADPDDVQPDDGDGDSDANEDGDDDADEGDDWAATRPAPPRPAARPAARGAASAYRAPTHAPAPPATNATTRYVFRASDAERQAGR